MIGDAAFNLIVEQEVTSQAWYEEKLRRPEWPGASSGATVGIGYDLGQTPRATVQADWQGRMPNAMVAAMMSACGETGPDGQVACRRIHDQVDIPWATALAVHRECVLPRWERKTREALPNTDKLSPNSFGVLVSLSFNRGASYSKDGERYAEMRAIKAHMAAQRFAEIPDEIRRMKRLWTLEGLLRRRDREADLFARGLNEAPAPKPVVQPAPPPLAPAATAVVVTTVAVVQSPDWTTIGIFVLAGIIVTVLIWKFWPRKK